MKFQRVATINWELGPVKKSYKKFAFSALALLVGPQEGPVKNSVVGCWRCCLSGARCRQLCDLGINFMTYTLFSIQDYQFQKVFSCFLR